MKDGIIKGDGTSRLARSVADFKSRYPNYDAFATALAAGTLPLDVLFHESGWSQLPDFLNKANLLKDSTAALYGLDSDSVPDNVLNLLSRFQNGLGNEYVWEKMIGGGRYESALSPNKSEITIASYTGGGGYYLDFEYGKSVTVDQNTHAISLADVFVPTTGPSTYNKIYWQGLLPFYQKRGDKIWCAKEIVYTDADEIYFAMYPVTSKYYDDTQFFGYVNSPDANAYPPAVADGYTYVPFGQIGGFHKMTTGSYVGSGTYGIDNPNKLTFDFEPKMVVIYTNGYTTGGWWFYQWNSIMDFSNINYWRTAECIGCSLFWRGNDAIAQLNKSDIIYKYIAWG